MNKNSKTFSLGEPRDLLGKLFSDIQDLSEAPTWNSGLRVYRSMNCFLTLWHMVDWFWVSLKRDKETFNRWKTTHPEQSTFDAFKKWTCTESTSMRVAQQIATATKHLNIDRDDPGVVAYIDYERKGNFSIPKDVTVEVDGKREDVEFILYAGRDFWTALIDEIFPEDIW